IGALSAGWLTDVFGRQKVLVGHNLFFIVGSLLMSLATNEWMLYTGRTLCGIAAGICTVAVPMYLSEIATDRTRGTLSILHQFAIVFGICIEQCIALGLATLNY